MLIYVEGPAGAGKSSFVQKAHELCPGDYIIFDEYTATEDPSTRKGYKTFLKNTEAKIDAIRDALSDDKYILVDRGHLSMLINAFVEQDYGLNTTFDNALDWYNEYKQSDGFLKPDLYVYISAPVELILQRARDNGWYRKDLGWTLDPQLSMDAYEKFLTELEPDTDVLRLNGECESKELVAEFLTYIDSNCRIN